MEIGNFIKIIRKYRYTILFVAIGIVYFFNMFINVMEIDAAQYANISMEMSWTKSFLQVYLHGKDYLDKPPLLFWLSSLSFLLLGISNFAYKLPSILIAILGIYSTYRFTKLWYSKQTALLAALVLSSCEALFLITNDVRTDTNLLGLMMFSVWQLSEYLEKLKWKNLVLSAIGIGGAMLAKGPIALVIPAAAFGTDFLLKRQWKNIFKPQWIILLIIVGLILLPMCYGLYTQFDLHPEKTVYGLKGPSGLRFFFWTQSFGRITGGNYWKNDTGYFYFLHTILWDFQPWILLFIPALILKVRKLIIDKIKSSESDEYITLGGFILVFIALSLSAYKLPHYIFVLFPFASIITADFIVKLKGRLQSGIARFQFGIMHLFWLLMVINLIFFFPPKNPLLPIVLIILYVANLIVFIKLKGLVERIFIPTIITIVAFNLLMATNFYPNLLKYQAGSQAGEFITANKIPTDRVYQFKNSSLSLDFYARSAIPQISNLKHIKKDNWVYMDDKSLDELKNQKINYEIIKTFPSFRVTALKLPFLYKKTRKELLKNEYLIKIM